MASWNNQKRPPLYWPFGALLWLRRCFSVSEELNCGLDFLNCSFDGLSVSSGFEDVSLLTVVSNIVVRKWFSLLAVVYKVFFC